MEAEGTSARVSFPVTGSRGVSKVRYTRSSGGSAGRVWINREQYFEGVDPEIWDFALCGYRPAQKWLKDRKDRVLSDDEIDHYRRIVSVLAETQHLMDEIDELIEQHGGWPDGFQIIAE